MQHDFNPRSPHGERHSTSCTTCQYYFNFNPRSPHGERRGMPADDDNTVRFQPTLPARGATPCL